MEKWTAFLHLTIICIFTQSSPAPVHFNILVLFLSRYITTSFPSTNYLHTSHFPLSPKDFLHHSLFLQIFCASFFPFVWPPRRTFVVLLSSTSFRSVLGYMGLLRASGMEEGVASGQNFRFMYVCGSGKET